MHPAREGNPLRRTSDVVQSWLTVLLVALLMLGVPAAAVGVGVYVHSAETQIAQTQSEERYRVSARLTADAEDVAAESGGYTASRAPVEWTARDGVPRTGTAEVPRRAQEGSTTRIWVDASGRVTTPPMSPSDAVIGAWLAALVAAGVVAALGFAARGSAIRLLDRRRYAQWETEWAELEPRWSGRHD